MLGVDVQDEEVAGEKERPHGHEQQAADRLDSPVMRLQALERREDPGEAEADNQERNREPEPVDAEQQDTASQRSGRSGEREDRSQHWSNAGRPAEGKRDSERDRPAPPTRDSFDSACPAAAERPRPAEAEHREAEEDDQRAGDAVQPGALADQEGADDRCARAECDEDAEEADEEERARGRNLTVDPLSALAQLLEADAADRGDVAGNQRENARRNEGDCAGGEDERQTESGDVYGSSPLRGLPREGGSAATTIW